MLQVGFIRQNLDLVKERLAVRNFRETELVDNVVGLDDQRKKLQLESDTAQSRINAISKEIGGLIAKGAKEAAEEKAAVKAEAKEEKAEEVKEAEVKEKEVKEEHKEEQA